MATATEPKKTIKRTQVIIPEDTKAKIVERIGDKTVSYDATVEETETVIQNDIDATDADENFDDADLFSGESETPLQVVPKSPLEIMFERVSEIVASNEFLFASVNRTPDAMTDRFNVPCNQPMSLGAVQFGVNDLFSFVPNIQRLAGNTGGRFNVLVYRQDQTPLLYFRRMRHGIVDGEGIHIGAMLYIPNPAPVENSQQQHNNNGNDMLTIIREMNDRSDARMQTLLESMNRKPEKSEIEQLLMQKAMEKLMTEPAPRDDFSMEKTMASIMQSGVVMASFGDAFAKMLNRDPTPIPEKSWLDNAKEVMEMPVVQSVIERVADVAEAAAVKNMQLPPATIENPQQQETTDDMQELIVTLITELESDRPLDHTNPTLVLLQNDYPDKMDMLQGFCQSLPFDVAVTTLGNMANKIVPHPFLPFLDVKKSQEQKQYIWNERGEKAMIRLAEFFEYVKVADFS
jgi:hypothetical protein